MNLSEKGKNRRILVVDDEADVLEFLRIFLESHGWEATTVPSAAEAIRRLEEDGYFCVLSDIAMPDMDGYEFMNLISAKHIPTEIVLMTGFGYNPNHTLVKVNQKLRYPCLFKPFDRTRLAATVRQAWDAYHGLSPGNGGVDTASP